MIQWISIKLYCSRRALATLCLAAYTSSTLAGSTAALESSNSRWSPQILEAAQRLAAESQIQALPEQDSYRIALEGLSFQLRIISGDQTTVELSGKPYSFSNLDQEDLVIAELAQWIDLHFDAKLQSKKAQDSLWSWLDVRLAPWLEELIPTAHAGWLGVALITVAVAAVVFAVVKSRKKKKEKEEQAAKEKKENDYREKIAYQLSKADSFRSKNAEALAGNTKVFQGRPNPDAHDCYIMSRAAHDHAKYFEKGYALDMNNYTKGCESYL